MLFLGFLEIGHFFIIFLLIFVYKEQDVSLPFLNYYLIYPPIMEKYQNKTFRVVAILFMLSTAPLAVTYSYAESEEGFELEATSKDPKSTDTPQKERLRSIITEKMVNGKLEVKQFALPESTSEEDMNRILSLEGTSGWSYVDYQGYHSGIVLFDGKASESGDKNWRISINGTLNLSKGKLDLEVIGKSDNQAPDRTKSLFNEDLGYRVIFSGKMLDSDEVNDFAIASMGSALEKSENLDIKSLHFGNPALETLNSIEGSQKAINPG